MTEQEWLVCQHPAAMLKFLGNKISHRKLRLFAVSCCRCVWERLTDERSRQAVEVAEGVTEGLVSEKRRNEVWLAARSVAREVRNPGEDESYFMDYRAACFADLAAHAVGPARNIGRVAAALQYIAKLNDDQDAAAIRQIPALLREIVGNPFRPVEMQQFWINCTVLSLARPIYDEHAFDRLPILADALEDAGCDNTELLTHCRQRGEHVRGCWVVDSLLCKE